MAVSQPEGVVAVPLGDAVTSSLLDRYSGSEDSSPGVDPESRSRLTLDVHAIFGVERYRECRLGGLCF